MQKALYLLMIRGCIAFPCKSLVQTQADSAAAAAKSRQSCPTLCDPTDGSPPGSHPWDSPGKNTGVGCHFLLQCMKVKSLSHVRLFETPWTVAYQAPPSMGFSRPEYWSGLPFPCPGDLPDPGIKPESPTLQADALPPQPPGKPPSSICVQKYF